MVQTLRGRWVGTEYVLEEEPMTEAEWLTSTDPQAMLRHLTHWTPSDRKLRLFACACCRLRWGELDQLSRGHVIQIEECVDGRGDMPGFDERLHPLAWQADDESAAAGAYNCIDMDSDIRKSQAALLREIIGNPFQPVVVGNIILDGIKKGRGKGPNTKWIDPDWLTPTVLMLAGRAYEERAGRVCGRCHNGKITVDLRPKGEPDYGPEKMYICQPPELVTMDCEHCHGTGRIEDGSLDHMTLAALADALEEAGCAGEPCKECHGSGTYTVQATNYALSRANGYGASTTYSEWRGCRHCGGDHDRKGTGRTPSPILAHLRSPGPHVRGCYVIDLLLGKE